MTAVATPATRRRARRVAPPPPSPVAAAPAVRPVPQARQRWRMGVEARALVVLTAVLLAFGLAVLYSASAVVAVGEGHASAYYLVRQLVGAAVGVVAFAAAAKVDGERWQRWAWPVMALCIALMLLTVLPFTARLAPRVHGSRRFLLGSSLQPSEFAKLAVVVWTAMLAVKKGSMLRRLTKGLFPFLVVVGVLDVLALLEPDLSSAMFFTLLMAVILFAGGVRIGHFLVLGLLVTPAMWHETARLQYALQRMLSFVDPASAPQRVSYQLKQSLIAVGSGRFAGVGYGSGHQQYGFLPFPFSDFIASNVGEEWGFVGLAALVAAFALYGHLGFRIARAARTPFLQLVGVGLTLTTVLTAFLHVGVVVGLLPTTGLTLPFISYGRSNLILSLLMTGILVNIGSTGERVHHEGATDPLEG